jgi:hypothetical protein
MHHIGLLIHGPEVTDEGEVRVTLEKLKAAGFETEAALGGITGKTAVIDAGMKHVIDISKDRKPSQVVEDFVKRGVNFIILLNHAKTEESGFILGEGILRNFIARSSVRQDFSFVQLEYSSKIIIRWRVVPEDEAIYKRVTDVFNEFEQKEPYKLESRCIKKENLVFREIKGVHPGEKIVVDGVVVGISSNERKDGSVTLVAKDGKLVNILGGTLIEHNLEKLPPLDLEKEMIKTGSVIRRTKPARISNEEVPKNRRKKKRACLFCTVENLFPKIIGTDADIEVAVTIGDDTTSIAGDILKRFGIRMIGITDGDADGLINGISSGALEEYEKFLPGDSLIIRLKPERDDVIGKRVRDEVFKGGEEIDLEGDIAMHVEDLRLRILNLAEPDIIGVLSSLPQNSEIKKRKT